MSYGSDFALEQRPGSHPLGRDHEAESRHVADAIRARHPAAVSVLDVGCGTGEHLAYLEKVFDEVGGLDDSQAALDVAGARLPGAKFHHADMCTFDLGRRYDAIMCVFAIADRQRSAAELLTTLKRFAGHLEPGGVVVFDPWWFAERFVGGYVAADLLKVEGQTVGCMSHSTRDGDRSRTEVHYVVADAGIRHVSEVLWHNLFPRALYEKALGAAGFEFEYIDGIMSGRGMFVGTLTQAGRAR